jgi:sulfate adenylyltransferase
VSRGTPPAEAAPELVELRLEGTEREAALDRARGRRRIPIDRHLVLDAEKLANGTFSPLVGFLGSADYRAVLSHMRLADGRPWTIPITLTIDPRLEEPPRPGEEVLLWNAEENQPCALLQVEEVYPVDLALEARTVYGTDDPAHPGVRRLLSGGSLALAGPIRLLQHSSRLIPARYDLDPREIRAEIRKRGFRTTTGFQTRNLGHKAHEHLQKIGLELTDGLLVHPLIGWKKAGDMLPEVILDGYELLIDRYYPKERTLLAGLTTAMRYAGPREAVFHALIRRNFGCTHFIVGRDHAGVGGYYEKYAAHRIFDHFSEGELGIAILRLHGPCYCEVCDGIVTERTCPHGPEAWRDISGTEIRAMIGRGERPPRTIMRPELAEFLIARARTGPVFFEGAESRA